VRVYLGARTKAELFFQKRMEDAGAELIIATDDGSCGEKGFVTNCFSKDLKTIQRAVTCGPEVMMVKVVDACMEHNVHVQASLERYMKCGVGICDACNCGGALICRDGPVFDGKRLARLNDFGKCKRDISGKKVNW